MIKKRLHLVVLFFIIGNIISLKIDGMDEKLELVSKDSVKVFFEKREVLDQSQLVKDMYEEQDGEEEDSPIPIPHVEEKALKRVKELFVKSYALRDKSPRTKKKLLVRFIEKKKEEWEFTEGLEDFIQLCRSVDYMDASDIVSALAFGFAKYNDDGLTVDTLLEIDANNFFKGLAKEYFFLYKKPLPIIGLKDAIEKDDLDIYISSDDDVKLPVEKKDLLLRQLTESAYFEVVYPVFINKGLHKIAYRNFTLSDFGLADFDISEKTEKEEVREIIWQLLDSSQLLYPALFEVTYKNPAIEKLKSVLLTGLNEYVSAKACQKGFKAWFNNVKKVPGFAEKIAERVWAIANATVKPGYGKKEFDYLEEENLLKFAFRVVYYQKNKTCIDDMDVSNVFGKDELKQYTARFYDYYDHVSISVTELEEHCNMGASGITYDDFANMFLYLTLAVRKESLQAVSCYTFDFCDNKLQTFPEALYNAQTYAKKASVVSLVGNRLDSLPVDIDNMSNVQDLDLSFNSIKEVPHEVLSLKKLRKLNMKGNFYLKKLSRGMARIDIQDLDIRETDVATLPTWFEDMKALKKLHIDKGIVSKNEAMVRKLKKKTVVIDVSEG